MTLNMLAPGDTAIICSVGGEEALRCRLLDMGFTPGTRVRMLHPAPLGDPVRLLLRGYELALRRQDAQIIRVEREHKGSGVSGGRGGKSTWCLP